MQSLRMKSSCVRFHVEWLEYVQCGKKSARIPHQWNQYHNRIWWHIIGNHWLSFRQTWWVLNANALMILWNFQMDEKKKTKYWFRAICVWSLSISLWIEDSTLHSLYFRSFNMPMDVPYQNWNGVVYWCRHHHCSANCEAWIVKQLRTGHIIIMCHGLFSSAIPNDNGFCRLNYYY